MPKKSSKKKPSPKKSKTSKRSTNRRTKVRTPQRAGKRPGALKKVNKTWLKRKSKAVTQSDIARVVKERKVVLEKARSGPLSEFFSDIKDLMGLLKDWVTGDYDEIPFWVISAITVALAYVVSPIDLIPDIIPIIGYVDDALVVKVCLDMIGEDLSAYRRWRARRRR